MRTGLVIDERGLTVEQVVARAGQAAAAGVPAVWLGQHYSWDPLIALTAIGVRYPDLALGTAIVPTYPVHPLALASAALSVRALVGDRLTLGVGPSHDVIMRDRFGYCWRRPASHTREYLAVLGPLLRREAVDHHGAEITAVGAVDVPPEPRPGPGGAPSLLLSALGPTMLRLAGELADGTITNWMVPRTIAEYVVPLLTGSGQRSPRIVATVAVAVTDDPAAVRAEVATAFAPAGTLPSYRAVQALAVLDRQGLHGPGDVVIAGDETAVARALRDYQDAGATEVAVAPVGSPEEQDRTIALLAALSSP